MPPFKPPYAYSSLGDQVQLNYNFLERLFDPGTQEAFRKSFFDSKDEPHLRNMLRGYDIDIPAPTRIVLVDLENAKWFVHDPKAFDPVSQDFYQLVMPPVPRKHPGSDEYKESQQYEDAWYHAVVDSYGM
jgi:hypothetical protein